MKKTLWFTMAHLILTISVVSTLSWAAAKEPVEPAQGQTPITTPTPQPPGLNSVIYTQNPPTPDAMKTDKQGAPLLVVEFETDHSDIPPAFRSHMDAFAQYLLAHSDTRAEISAHADNSGHGPANGQLAQKRADAVYAYLVHAGVSANRINAKGYGEITDKASNSTAAGKQADRRAFGVIKRG